MSMLTGMSSGEWAFSGVTGALTAGASLWAGATLAPVIGLGVAGFAVGKYLGSRFRASNDKFRGVVIPPEESQDEIKRDVNSAMAKIQKLILEKAEVHPKLGKKGRDYLFYAPILSGSKNLVDLVKNWNSTWSIDATAGLLLDLQSALKGTALQGSAEDRTGLSQEQRDIRDKGYGGTKFGQEMRQLGDTQANPSATTANLLTFLRTTQNETNITPLEIEAIMQAVIMFWEGRSKRYTGEFHTPIEVWMAYAQHLEKSK